MNTSDLFCAYLHGNTTVVASTNQSNIPSVLHFLNDPVAAFRILGTFGYFLLAASFAYVCLPKKVSRVMLLVAWGFASFGLWLIESFLILDLYSRGKMVLEIELFGVILTTFGFHLLILFVPLKIRSKLKLDYKQKPSTLDHILIFVFVTICSSIIMCTLPCPSVPFTSLFLSRTLSDWACLMSYGYGMLYCLRTFAIIFEADRLIISDRVGELVKKGNIWVEVYYEEEREDVSSPFTFPI